MKKALLLAPMGSVHRRFNKANIEALQMLGYEVELCANFVKGEGPEAYNQDFVEKCESVGIKTHSIAFARHSLMGCLRCLPLLKKLLKEKRYDIVHAHTETGGLLLRLSYDVKGESKFLYTPHGMSFWKGSSLKSQILYRPLEHWICSCMDLNLGMNMEEIEYLKYWNKSTATYVHGIGLDIKHMQKPIIPRECIRKDFNMNDDDTFIISIGELNDNKNHIVVIRALAKLKCRNFRYIVCGVGPNKDILMAEAKRLGIEKNVVLVGFRSDIPDILNAADIFVFPSFHEGMPVSVLEAMACGLPIICSNIRGNVDLVIDGSNGFLFEPDDPVFLYHKLMLLMGDMKKCKIMGEKNKKLVESFSVEAVTEELKQIYKSVG